MVRLKFTEASGRERVWNPSQKEFVDADCFPFDNRQEGR